MTLDLFDLIDRFFSGVVVFFFNIFQTMYAVLRHPLRGPLRLYLNHRNKKYRQASGISFLFMTFFLAFLLIQQMADEGQGLAAAGKLGRDIVKGVAGSDRLWPAFSVGLLCTVIVDTALRILLRLKYPERPCRRDVVRSVVEYALFLPLAFLIYFPLLIYFAVTVAADSLSTVILAMFGAILLVVVCPIPALLPAAILFTSGGVGAGRRRATGSPAAPRWRWLKVAGNVILLGVIVGGAALCGIAAWVDVMEGAAPANATSG